MTARAVSKSWGLLALRTALQVGLVTAMYSAASSVHQHARSESHQDLGCVGICKPDQPCHCGWSYSREFPTQYSRANLMLLGGALCVSLLGTVGMPPAARARRAVALVAVAHLALSALTFDLGDWHGDVEVLYSFALGLASFPLNLLAFPFMLSTRGIQLPHLGGDPVFGGFSTTLAVNHVILGICAYLQWFVVAPWLRSRVRRWRAVRASREQELASR